MDEIKFRNWLLKNGKNKKVCSDTISRIKKIERELGNIDLDEEYEKDQCQNLLNAFKNTGRNEQMEKYNSNLPIGRYHLSTYKYAVQVYISFKNELGNTF